ncbi:unnamed protein product [Lasius platythorax]|uniref:Uncharacterized protein n=1 Tax=Lasius platythorax TaxID=488582 RepID=A0AAV2NI71_9HYME
MTLGCPCLSAVIAYASVRHFRFQFATQTIRLGARQEGSDPRASSNLHLPLSSIVSANFALTLASDFPRFGKLAIPIPRGTPPFEHGDEEKSAATPFGRGVSIFQYNAARVRGVSPLKMR